MNNEASRAFDNAVNLLSTRTGLSFKAVCDALVSAKA